ncbi:hypothetical protein AGLY_006577 [Aphis glycines]|uniref:DDE Tnp4 domain-containing protein n=1 Tax=Aphis glycines TaxID=307491 RepID=A0A6G0TRJ6_APHGL|nr:hypothetical protein AGLY_006577 [Aphis glycines]
MNTEHFMIFQLKNYLFSKESFGVLMHLIVEYVKHGTKRNVALSPEVQVLITLRYYATGTFQVVIGVISELIDLLYVELLKEFQLLLLVFNPQFINMPQNAHERSIVSTGFYKIRNFPCVIGSIDCTHIRIQSPNSDIGERFRNRKGEHIFVHEMLLNGSLEFGKEDFLDMKCHIMKSQLVIRPEFLHELNATPIRQTGNLVRSQL